ncbi:Mor transcription activator family protein [Acinetobacter soli]
MTLVQRFGGHDYSFPPVKSVTESHELSILLGFNNLRKLCQFWNGDRVYIPKADRYIGLLRDQRIKQDLEELGASSNIQDQLAEKYRVTPRWIRKIRKDMVENKPAKHKDDDQLDLFEA